MDQNDIMLLTQNVKDFSDALANLRNIFTEDTGNGDEAAYERLGDVLFILKNVLQIYPVLQSCDLLSASTSLITKIKGHTSGDYIRSEDIQVICDAVDSLAISFSSSVSEYLMGDTLPEIIEESMTKSYNNLTADVLLSSIPVNSYSTKQLCAKDIDSILVKLETGLDLALQRAKAWSKHTKGIMAYIEKKAQLEIEYARSLSKLVHSTRQSLTNKDFVTLQSVYSTVLDQDVEYAGTCQATQTLLLTSRFIEPLLARRSEHDKIRKNVKECWFKEIKKMRDIITNLIKAQTMYIDRQHDHARAEEALEKAEGDKLFEKRRKLKEEALLKAAEAETTYKACVAETNTKLTELEKMKGEWLTKICEQIELSDQVMKTVTSEYFHLLHTVAAPVPVQYQILCETVKNNEIGSQFAEYVRSLVIPSSKTEMFPFEPYNVSKRVDTVKSSGTTLDNSFRNDETEGSSALFLKEKLMMPVKAWGQAMVLSDTDSISESSKNPQSIRPKPVLKKIEEISEEDSFFKDESERKLENVILGDEVLDVSIMSKHQRGLMHTEIPPIITKCLAEVEKKGMEIKGLYRVSGVKSKVENLCRRFEMDPSIVTLHDVHPNVLSSVVKQYLRHLPEPLLTFNLYPEFISVAKDVIEHTITYQQGVEKLQSLVLKLPVSNLKTCAVLIHHLQRVASHCDYNQMSAVNLGIVFGPTLLKPYDGTASLASLVDTPYQTHAVEMLISSAQTIFGSADQFQIKHVETPVEHIDLSDTQDTPADDKRSIKVSTPSNVATVSSTRTNYKTFTMAPTITLTTNIDTTENFNNPIRSRDAIIEGDTAELHSYNVVCGKVVATQDSSEPVSSQVFKPSQLSDTKNKHSIVTDGYKSKGSSSSTGSIEKLIQTDSVGSISKTLSSHKISKKKIEFFLPEDETESFLNEDKIKCDTFSSAPTQRSTVEETLKSTRQTTSKEDRSSVQKSICGTVTSNPDDRAPRFV